MSHCAFRGGDAQLAYYADLVSGEGVSAQTSSYPGLFDLPLAIVHKAFPEWGTRSQKGHVWSFFFGLLGLLSIWRMTARLGGERAGFFALLLLVTVPRYYGHMFFNPKDVPLAGTYALGLWAVVSLLSRLPRPAWRYVIAIGFAAGVALSARALQGFLVLCYFGLFIGLFLLAKYGRAAVRGRKPSMCVQCYLMSARGHCEARSRGWSRWRVLFAFLADLARQSLCWGGQCVRDCAKLTVGMGMS